MNPLQPQRGATLIEALVALLILTLSLLATLRLQTWLRLNADLARERGIAVRQAQQDLERLRTFRDLPAFDTAAAHHSDTRTPTTSFSLQRSVHDTEGLKTLHTQVSWQHRGGAAHTLQLASSVARLAPVYSAALALPPQDHLLALRRQLPSGAHTFPDSRTLLKPTRHSSIAWLIDNITGDITQQCRLAPSTDRLDTSDLATCEPHTARLLRGYIRYSLSSHPGPLHANDVPLSLSVQAAQAHCETETIAADGERYIAYACALPSAHGPTVEPSLIPQGWAFGLTAAAFKACRYPGSERAPRNYLVIRGDLTCPSAVPPHNGAPVVTVQHQP